MSTAFVLSGGGSLGAVQVGMLQALAERGITPDLLVGTSAGALNAAWVADHGASPSSLEELAGVWTKLRRSDIFPMRIRRALGGLIGVGSALYPAERLGDLIDAHAGVRLLEDAAIPVHMVSTDLLSGCAVLLSEGSVRDAVLASAAIPGIFPPVAIDGQVLVDGGVAEYSGVAHAAALGATEIYVVPAGVSCALARAPRSAFGIAMHSLTFLISQRLQTEVAAVSDRSSAPVVRVVPPLCPLSVSATDFSHGEELIERAHSATARWLRSDGPELPDQARFLSLHSHGTSQNRRTNLASCTGS